MKLRIISGFLKGRFITVPDSTDFRPTSERTRESLAEIIKAHLPGKRVADFCAGSGAMGFEMISRGATHVDFVEMDKNRAATINKNALGLGISECCRVITKDIRSFLKDSSELYDLIFFDPPYDNDELKDMTSSLLKRLTEAGIMIYEFRKIRTSKIAVLPETRDVPYDSRTYGDTVVEFYCKQVI
jgi:16S rRNA (guanine966-N2)-methyltransferase